MLPIRSNKLLSRMTACKVEEGRSMTISEKDVSLKGSCVEIRGATPLYSDADVD